MSGFRWQLTQGGNGRLTARSEFGLIPIEGIWEVVNVVPGDNFILQTSSSFQGIKLETSL